jgi:signal peptide peptidase SppA
MSNLHRILDQAIGRPLLLTPEKAMVIYDVLAGRVDLATFAAAEAEEMRGVEPMAYRNLSVVDRYGRAVPLYPNVNGVAQITIDGSLVNRGAYIGASSGVVSYEGIRSQIRTAVADSDVRGIMLDINSPGGQASGMFSLAEEVRNAATQKPVVAFVNDMAASAAYGIASGATEIVVSRSSVVGSIGVVLLHLDRSGELAQKGVTPTLIHAGANKVDGHAFAPLPESVRSSLQAEVNKIYDLFLDTVAQGRGRKMSKKAVRATEARVFMGQDAIDAGLADAIATVDQVIDALSRGRKVSASVQQPQKGAKMVSEDNPTPEAAAPVTPTASLPAATAPITPSAPAAPVARPSSAATERERIKEIQTCAEAAGREQLAQHLAFNTDLSADAAKTILAAAPKAEAAPAATVQSFLEQKAADGALGLSPVTESATPAAKSGWSKAVAEANRRFEPVR